MYKNETCKKKLIVFVVCYYIFIIACSSLIIIRFLFIVVCVYSCVFLYLIMNIVFGYDSDSEYVLQFSQSHLRVGACHVSHVNCQAERIPAKKRQNVPRFFFRHYSPFLYEYFYMRISICVFPYVYFYMCISICVFLYTSLIIYS